MADKIKTDTKEYKAEYLKDIDPTELESLAEPWERVPGIDDPFLITGQNVIWDFDASDIAYDNSTSWLSATTVQDAIDELAALHP